VSLFDRLNDNQEGNANAKVANPANDEASNDYKLATLAELALATSPKQNLESPSLTPLPVVVASDGRVLAWTNDPPIIRLYAWALQNLRFVPVDAPTAKSLKVSSGEMDRLRIGKLARELRMPDREVQAALNQLVREGDLMVKTERGLRIYWLAPLQ